MKLIDADKLICVSAGTLHPGVPVVPFGKINVSPTVDAVPVVRCGECKSHFNWQNGSGVCRKCGINTTDDFYCADGERKDGEK